MALKQGWQLTGDVIVLPSCFSALELLPIASSSERFDGACCVDVAVRLCVVHVESGIPDADSSIPVEEGAETAGDGAGSKGLVDNSVDVAVPVDKNVGIGSRE